MLMIGLIHLSTQSYHLNNNPFHLAIQQTKLSVHPDLLHRCYFHLRDSQYNFHEQYESLQLSTDLR